MAPGLLWVNMLAMTSHDRKCEPELHSAIDRYLREHFRKEPTSTLGRWMGELPEYSYVVRSATLHEVSGVTRGYSVLRVTVEDDFLQRKERGGGSTGLFSVRNGEVLCLTPEHPEYVTRLMQAVESVTDETARAFAELWCEAALSKPDAHYFSLKASQDVGVPYPEARGYELDREVWRRAELRFIPPTWQRDEAGVGLEFFALVADFRRCGAHRIAVRVAADGAFTVSDDVIAESIFKRTPFVRM